MRNLPVAFLAAIVAVFTVSGAAAQSNIDLGTSTAPGDIQFLDVDGMGTFTINICGSVKNGVCTLGGISGAGTGTGGFAGNNGYYTITGGGISATMTSSQGCSVCTWTLSGPALNFQFWTGKNETGTELLVGTFQLVSMSQTKGVNGLDFNQTVVLNFTPTGGTLASYFGTNGGYITLDLVFTTNKSLATIPKNQSRFGWIADGDVTATPEPGTMALLGSGCLLVGGYLRKKFRA